MLYPDGHHLARPGVAFLAQLAPQLQAVMAAGRPALAQPWQEGVEHTGNMTRSHNGALALQSQVTVHGAAGEAQLPGNGQDAVALLMERMDLL